MGGATWRAAALLLLAATAPAQAEAVGETLKRGLLDEAELTVHVRSYYLDHTNPQPPNHVAWAGGGWVGYQTGWLFDGLRFGVVGYTSQPLWAPPETDGTLLLLPGQRGFVVLGEAYGTLRAWGQEFTAYRQRIEEPEVNPQDNRFVPNTFEAYLLRGQLGQVRYLAGYVARMKTRNADTFVNMAMVAGAPETANEGMMLAGIDYAPDKRLAARLSGYHVPNVLTSGYGDVAWLAPLTERIDVRLAGQLMVQGSTGSHVTASRDFSTLAGGVDLRLIADPVTLRAAFTQIGRSAAYSTPYGVWAGYTSMIASDFNRANESSVLVGGVLDFAAAGLPGLTLGANLVFGYGAINPATGAVLSTNHEFDFALDYRFANSGAAAPEWLKSLWLRASASLIDQFENGTMSPIRDYRLILNYEWKFGGKRG